MQSRIYPIIGARFDRKVWTTNLDRIVHQFSNALLQCTGKTCTRAHKQADDWEPKASMWWQSKFRLGPILRSSDAERP